MPAEPGGSTSSRVSEGIDHLARRHDDYQCHRSRRRRIQSTLIVATRLLEEKTGSLLRIRCDNGTVAGSDRIGSAQHVIGASHRVDSHRVDVADQVGRRNVGGGELLPIAFITMPPDHWQCVTVFDGPAPRLVDDRVIGVLTEFIAAEDGRIILEDMRECRLAWRRANEAQSYLETPRLPGGAGPAMEAQQAVSASVKDHDCVVKGATIPFAFSTLGCPHSSLAQILELAHSQNVGGLELRAGPDAIVDPALSRGGRVAVRRQIADSGVQALSVCSYLKVCEPGSDDDFLQSLGEHLRLAQDIGARFVRVFPGANGAGKDGDKRAVRRLSSVTQHAAESGVRILVETHDSHPTGADIAAILSELDARCPDHAVGVIWDVLHPWRAGEAPEATLRSIAPWLEYVQIKDASATGELRLVGDGNVPLDEIATLLRDRPNLWWSLEWERLWDPTLAALPIALGAARSWYDRRVESQRGENTH